MWATRSMLQPRRSLLLLLLHLLLLLLLHLHLLLLLCRRRRRRRRGWRRPVWRRGRDLVWDPLMRNCSLMATLITSREWLPLRCALGG